MAVETTNTSSGPYETNGVTTDFPFTFKVVSADEVAVKLVDSDGNETEVSVSDYDVTLSDPGGTVSFATAPVTGYDLYVDSAPSFAQNIEFEAGGAFLAASHNQANDRAAIRDQVMSGRIDRAILLPRGDPGATLPIASARAGKYLAFDAGGEIVPSTGTGADDGLREDLSATSGSTIVGFVQDGDDAVARTMQNKVREVQFSVNDFKRAAESDHTNALTRAVAVINASSASGCRLVFPPGSYNIASATIASSAFTWTRNNVTVEGYGATVTLTGGSVTAALFASAGRSNIRYLGLKLVGNKQADAFANGAAIKFVNDGTSDIFGLTVENCWFESFKGDWWIYTETFDTGKLRSVRIHNNDFVSSTGVTRGPADIAIPNAFVGIYGSPTTGDGVTTDVWITNNRMAADYMKSGVAIFHNVRDFHVIGNTIKNAGLQEISDDCGAYAITVYETYPPENGGDGFVCNNIILSPRSCGIYQAGPHNGMVYRGNIVRGQTDTQNGTLPKGGIALNGGTNNIVEGNQITDCAADGIWWGQVGSGADQDARILISRNAIEDCARGVVIQSSFEDAFNVSVHGNSITNCTSGAYLDLYTSATLNEVSVSGNKIISTVTDSYGVRVESTDASFKVDKLSITGNKIDVAKTAIIAPSITVGSVSIADNDLHGPFTEAGVAVDSSTKVLIGTNRLYGQTVAAGGFCFRTSGAQGPFAEQQYHACESNALIRSSGSEDLGRSAPTFVPTGKGIRVHSQLEVEAGTTPQKYLILGYQYDGAWRTLYAHTEVPS